jgi:hypothetical protein
MRMKITTAMLVGIVLATGGPATAQKWVRYKVEYGVLVRSIDMETAKVEGKTVTAWFREERTGKPAHVIANTRWFFDCANRRKALLNNVIFDMKGEVVVSEDNYANPKYRPIVPDGDAQADAVKAACKLVK